MRLKKIIIVFFTLLTLCIIGIPIILVTFGLESKPLVIPGEKLTIQDVERVKKMLEENDPRKLQQGKVEKVSITERDLNLFLDYALSRAPQARNLSANIELQPNLANAHCTFLLPDNPFGTYLNVTAMISQLSPDIVIDKLKIGTLTVPYWLLKPLIQYAHENMLRYEEYRIVFEGNRAIEDIQLNKNNMIIAYQLQRDMLDQLQARGQNLLLPAEERERLRVYNERLSEISRTKRIRNISLTKFLRPMFRLARERTINGSDPIAENRALILSLAMYATKINVEKILGTEGAKRYQVPRQINLILLGRHDLAQHFLVSAAVTVSAGGGLANLVGLFKEMDDSRGGSGFSFADLAADRAGVKLGEIAISSLHQGNLLQKQMLKGVNEADFMPRVDHLPEGIMELEFKQRYKDLDSDTYRTVEKEIERRIAACKIYQ